ncbi:hypothetical protein GGX14DRAFT_611455 [Mycena pura]|uniref:HNH nuclease domain-containing protein n=1 Tax=Mycena pura TaxID=153505 RepID=A0AAD6YS34_9AGAR|nr:hypothetical protein GGX14DRAFT_611455 [Mycena pura]
MDCIRDGGDLKPKKGQSIPLSVQTVQVYHPGYKPPKVMMILAAFEAQSGQRGVPFFVVLWACRILANNKDGILRVLNTDVDLTAPADDADDKKLLLPGQYAYHIPGEGYTALRRLYRIPFMESAHRTALALAPRHNGKRGRAPCFDRVDFKRGGKGRRSSGEKPWWIYHDMSSKTNNPQGINSPSNCLSVRADLNAEGMDKGHFIFAPVGGKAVCVCITPEIADFAAEYHLRVVDIPPRIHPLNLYARFAWGLFKALEPTLHDFALDPSSETVRELDLPRLPSKRKRARDDDAGREQEDADAGREEQDDDGAGGGGDNRTQVMDDAGPLLSSDDEVSSEATSEPSLDLCAWTERDLAVAERMDAAFAGRSLAPHEVQAGMYPGYSKALRLKQEYRKQHPEVSAVRSARVAHVGEDNDEQSL